MFPLWFNEIHQGNLKVRLGHELDKNGVPTLIVSFEERKEFGAWKKLGTFQYLDMVHVTSLFGEVETYVRSLVPSR